MLLRSTTLSSAVHDCAVAVAAAVYFAAPAQAANVRECQALEQRYSEIRTAASSIERNIMLFNTAQHGCLPLAKTLLDDGASLEARDGLGNMPLAKAVKQGHADLVKLFLERKAPVDSRNLEASTALFIACEEERRTIAELLLAAGADPNLAGRSGLPPIAAAAYSGNPDLVSLLIAKGAEIRVLDATGKSALVYAAGRAHTTVVRQLIEAGAAINQRYDHDLTALMWAAGHSEEAGAADVKETLELLIAKGAHLDDADDRGRTALMTAAELGHVTALEALLKAGANAALKDRAGKSAKELAEGDGVKAALIQCCAGKE